MSEENTDNPQVVDIGSKPIGTRPFVPWIPPFWSRFTLSSDIETDQWGGKSVIYSVVDSSTDPVTPLCHTTGLRKALFVMEALNRVVEGSDS